MAEPAEFSTAELDHLEDALEGLELAPPTGAIAPRVGDRLAEYRNILALSRAAMPMVDVPRGLLDDVIAQARAAAEVPTVVSSATPTERPGFWARVRRFGLLPGFALAGTAAAVMLTVESKPDLHDSAAIEAPVAVEGARDSAGVERRSTAGPAPAAAPAPATAQDQAAADRHEPEQAELGLEIQRDESSDRGNAIPGGAAPPKRAAVSAVSAAPASPAAEPIEKKEVDLRRKNDAPTADAETPRWDIIARGDRARHRGECGAARNEYSLALGDVDARVRARAHAGLGLCEAQAGNRSAADAAYQVARELDGEIARFIEDERPRGAGTSAAKAKPKASTNAGKSKVDDGPDLQQQAE